MLPHLPRLAPTKVLYFCYFAGLSAVAPYLPIYYRQAGASGFWLGLFVALPPLVGLVAAPLWGALADGSGQPRRVLQAVLAATALALLGVYHTSHLAVLGLATLAYSICTAPLIALLDSSTLAVLGERRAEYGRHRIWGSWGWMLTSLVAGYGITHWGLRVGVWVYLGFTLVNLWATTRFRVAAVRAQQSFWQALRRVAGNPTWRLFLLVALLGGIGLSMAQSYIFLVIDLKGIDSAYKGWSMVASCASELPVMWWGARLLRRFGARRLVGAALVLYVVRCAWLAQADSGLDFILGQATQGVTYGLIWIGGVSLAHRLAPPGMHATAQGLFNAINGGLGVGVGSLAAGWLLGRFGPAVMYGAAAAGLALGLAVAVVLAGRQPQARG